MKTVILAGGLGTRLQEETVVKPKPMVEIGGQPMLWHIMKIFSSYGIKDFGIAMGYKSEIIRSYFLNYYYHNSNFTIHTKTGKVDLCDGKYEDWSVYLADTGANTQTGGRLKRFSSWVGNETFMLTYGDGVSDVNIKELIDFHKSHGKLATVTAVRPPYRFGGLSIENDLVKDFVEKPDIGESWSSGGFFILEPEVFDYIEGDSTVFEKAPMEHLAKEGQLMAYKHNGFWQCMDTLRDVQFLESLWASGKAPWKKW